MLDLCCGPGRHPLEFARRGFQVTGVDRTAGYLETARAAATREGLLDREPLDLDTWPGAEGLHLPALALLWSGTDASTL